VWSEEDSLKADRLVDVAAQAANRYADAYRVASAVIVGGTTLKILAGIAVALPAVSGLIIAAGSRNGWDGAVGAGVGLGGLLVAVPLYGLGLVVTAQGQLLRASLDSAVHSSPFMDDLQRAKAMGFWVGRGAGQSSVTMREDGSAGVAAAPSVTPPVAAKPPSPSPARRITCPHCGRPTSPGLARCQSCRRLLAST
jgi:hypothetical protein